MSSQRRKKGIVRLMKVIKKSLIVLLILSTVNLFIPKAIFAEPAPTKNPLEIRSTPEEEIPTIKEKKTSGWKWLIVLGLVGGVVAVAAGGGGNGGDSETGDVDYDW
jgi:hypothetical protein